MNWPNAWGVNLVGSTAPTDPTRRDILAVLDECAPHFSIMRMRQPTMSDLANVPEDELEDLYEWACACRLTCIDVVDWALEPTTREAGALDLV